MVSKLQIRSNRPDNRSSVSQSSRRNSTPSPPNCAWAWATAAASRSTPTTAAAPPRAQQPGAVAAPAGRIEHAAAAAVVHGKQIAGEVRRGHSAHSGSPGTAALGHGRVSS